MKKLLAATAIAICFGAANPSMAADTTATTKLSKEEFKKLTPEQKEAFKAKKKAEWQKLSKEEKLKLIEERRQKRIKKMDDKWAKMSDDEKIKFVEERMERKGKHGGKHHDDAE